MAATLMVPALAAVTLGPLSAPHGSLSKPAPAVSISFAGTSQVSFRVFFLTVQSVTDAACSGDFEAAMDVAEGMRVERRIAWFGNELQLMH